MGGSCHILRYYFSVARYNTFFFFPFVCDNFLSLGAFHSKYSVISMAVDTFLKFSLAFSSYMPFPATLRAYFKILVFVAVIGLILITCNRCLRLKNISYYVVFGKSHGKCQDARLSGLCNFCCFIRCQFKYFVIWEFVDFSYLSDPFIPSSYLF